MSDTLELRDPCVVLGRARTFAFYELAKARILLLVLVATAAGFYLAVPPAAEPVIWFSLIHVLIGTALVVAGSNALNQYLEVDFDAQMVRTAGRPLPSGRLSPTDALVFGVLTGAAGAIYLSIATNALTGLLAAVSFVNYVFLYTPMKRWTTFSVFVGAVSGALPPVIGWAAAAGRLGTEAWVLFSILFFWQLPHFASIAWLYREDYGRAGYPMLPVVDPRGIRSDLHLVTHTVALLAASLLPAFYGTAGPLYAIGAMLLGAAFLACGGVFVHRKTDLVARCHVLASIIYLPLLFAALMLDKALAR